MVADGDDANHEKAGEKEADLKSHFGQEDVEVAAVFIHVEGAQPYDDSEQD